MMLTNCLDSIQESKILVDGRAFMVRITIDTFPSEATASVYSSFVISIQKIPSQYLLLVNMRYLIPIRWDFFFPHYLKLRHRKVGLVLSGGGARGLAHIGDEILEENGWYSNRLFAGDFQQVRFVGCMYAVMWD